MRLLAWFAAHMLYVLGDVVWLVVLRPFGRMFPLYCWFMLQSLRINDRYGLHVWKAAKSLMRSDL